MCRNVLLADLRRLKQSSIHVSSPQENPDDQPLGVEVEPAVMITTTMERRASRTNLDKQQNEISIPQEENHDDQPLGTRVTSTCKRKEPPTIHSVVRKRLKSKVKKPAPLDLNIS